MFGFSNTTGGIMLACLSLFLGWVLSLYIYRLTLHPLSRFPGPKLAAVTRWYEYYYDVTLQGQFVFVVQKLHQQYGKFILSNGLCH